MTVTDNTAISGEVLKLAVDTHPNIVGTSEFVVPRNKIDTCDVQECDMLQGNVPLRAVSRGKQ